MALWTKQSGAQVPPRRDFSRPSRATRQAHHNKNKHTSTLHPELLSEHMIRAVWRRGTQGHRPYFNHTTARPASSARPALALRSGAQPNTKGRHTKEGKESGKSDHQARGIGVPTPPQAKLATYPNLLPFHPSPVPSNRERAQAVKGEKEESSSTAAHSHSSPPVSARRCTTAFRRSQSRDDQ